MAARDDDLRPARAVFHRHHVGAQAVADVVVLGLHALAVRHERLEFSEIDDHIRAVKAPHRAADNLARAILELVINHLLFRLADALHHRLLRGLRGDAPKVLRRDRHLDFLAELDVALEHLRRLMRDLVVFVLHLLHDRQLGESLDLARLRIDLDAQILRRTHGFAGRREHSSVDRFQEHITFDAFFALKKIETC